MQQNKISSIYYVYFTSVIAAVAGLLFGFDAGVISGALHCPE